MEKGKLELVVGVFVAVGLVCLGYLSIKLGKLELIGGNQYEVEAEFDSASGIKAGATVEIAGVEVGRVKNIRLKDDRAMVALAIHDGVKLYTDTIASIKTRGIIHYPSPARSRRRGSAWVERTERADSSRRGGPAPGRSPAESPLPRASPARHRPRADPFA